MRWLLLGRRWRDAALCVISAAEVEEAYSRPVYVIRRHYWDHSLRSTFTLSEAVLQFDIFLQSGVEGY